jgi:hypothetical protein
MIDKDFEVRVDVRLLAELVRYHDIYRRQVREANDVINEQRKRIKFLSEEIERLTEFDAVTLSGESA